MLRLLSDLGDRVLFGDRSIIGGCGAADAISANAVSTGAASSVGVTAGAASSEPRLVWSPAKGEGVGEDWGSDAVISRRG